MRLSVAVDFTRTPGPRYKNQGPKSGQLFREELLEPKYLEARQCGEKLFVDLDGVSGYAPSFLDESFGGLVRSYGLDEVGSVLVISSVELPRYREKAEEYMRKAHEYWKSQQ